MTPESRERPAMTSAQIQQFRTLLAAAKPPREQLGADHVFLRGFNEGLACAERLLGKALGEAGDSHEA